MYMIRIKMKRQQRIISAVLYLIRLLARFVLVSLESRLESGSFFTKMKVSDR